MAMSDVNAVIFASQPASQEPFNFRRSTGWFNRQVTGQVGSQKSRPVPSLQLSVEAKSAMQGGRC